MRKFALAWIVMAIAACTAVNVSAADEKDEMLTLHNSTRTTHGVPSLARNDLLDKAASEYAAYLLRSGGFGHYADGRNPGQRISATGYRMTTWGENMAMGYTAARPTFQMWMNSSGHRANVLGRGFRQIGIGRAGSYWVTCFATPLVVRSEPKPEPKEPEPKSEPLALSPKVTQPPTCTNGSCQQTTESCGTGGCGQGQCGSGDCDRVGPALIRPVASVVHAAASVIANRPRLFCRRCR